jgi:hypothetical protein
VALRTCVLSPDHSRASIDGRPHRRTIRRAPKPSSGLSSWGLQAPSGQERVLRQLRKRQTIASQEIDRLGDPLATDEERQLRKRRLIRGPKEFRDIRRNRPNE